MTPVILVYEKRFFPDLFSADGEVRIADKLNRDDYGHSRRKHAANEAGAKTNQNLVTDIYSSNQYLHDWTWK